MFIQCLGKVRKTAWKVQGICTENEQWRTLKKTEEAGLRRQPHMCCWQSSGSMEMLKDGESQQLTTDAGSLFYASAIQSMEKCLWQFYSNFQDLGGLLMQIKVIDHTFAMTFIKSVQSCLSWVFHTGRTRNCQRARKS